MLPASGSEPLLAFGDHLQHLPLGEAAARNGLLVGFVMQKYCNINRSAWLREPDSNPHYGGRILLCFLRDRRLQPDAADLGSFAARPAVIDRRQCQQAPRLSSILRPLRQLAHLRSVVIPSNQNRRCHGKLPPFATVNHIRVGLGIPYVSRVHEDLVLLGYTSRVMHNPHFPTPPFSRSAGWFFIAPTMG